MKELVMGKDFDCSGMLVLLLRNEELPVKVKLSDASFTITPEHVKGFELGLLAAYEFRMERE